MIVFVKKLFIFSLFLLSLSLRLSFADNTEDVLKIASNPLANVEDRKKAIETLNIDTDPRILTALIDIVKNKTESVIFRAYIVDLLMQSGSKWPVLELTNIVKDSSLPVEIRKQALYGLWMKDPQTFKPEVMKIAQSSAEPVELRVSAVTYLRTSGDTKLSVAFWKNLLSKNNDTQIRIAALNGMEQLGVLTQEKNVLIQIMQNPAEEIQIRKTSVLNAERTLGTDEVAAELIQMISKTDNPLEIRKFALDHLASLSPANFIPQLEKISALEKNPSFKKDLLSLISSIRTQKLA